MYSRKYIDEQKEILVADANSNNIQILLLLLALSYCFLYMNMTIFSTVLVPEIDFFRVKKLLSE
jgi:hypothetical protein